MFESNLISLQIDGKDVLVIGSQSPWLESILVSKGARLVTTFDYIRINNEHPNIETLVPNEMAKKFTDGVRFDAMITFSSIEHSGLGRCVQL